MVTRGLTVKELIPSLPRPSSALLNVAVPIVLLSNTARYKLNFKSSYWSAVHVDAFCDLNKTPAYGCSEIVLVPVMSISPIREIQTLYSLESENRTKQCSSDSGMNTGAGKLNLVEIDALSDTSNSLGVRVTSEKGRMSLVG